MTMLDRMRRHKGWLKWSLGAVVATFILLYMPSFLTPAGTGTLPTDTLATVEGRDITVGAYQRAYQQQVIALQAAYGDAVSDDLLRQLGVAQQVVQQLIDETAVVVEADRLGIDVTDAELRERIIRMPGLQENGQFVGDARYRQALASSRPPMNPAEFEAGFRQSLRAEKLRAAVTAWLQVSDAEVDAEHRRRNEKVKLELAIFTADQFREGIEPTDDDVSAYFDANRESYRVQDKRRVKYISVNAEALRETVRVTTNEINARYQRDLQVVYSTPEQVRASHILFKTEGADAEAVRTQAMAVLARVNAGEEFAALATEFSEDDGSKVNGGDLDYFGRGAMVPEFEEAAWALEPGATSDLVESPFGFHIIRVTDRREATTRPLADVQEQIEDQLQWERAQSEANELAQELADDIDDPADLDRLAVAHGLVVSDSGLFSRDEPLAGLGFAPAVSAEAFLLEPGQVSGALQTLQGFAFIAVEEVQPSYLPELADVAALVSVDVIRLKAVEEARTRAATMARNAARDFASAARTAGVEVRTTDLVTRGTPWPEVGVSGIVDDAVFALDAGAASTPIVTDQAVIVARVVERQEISEEGLDVALMTLRAEMIDRRRADFFASYMTKAKADMNIGWNEVALDFLLGG
jgi:peptidyl-prolyl cis-trans isomerase D